MTDETSSEDSRNADNKISRRRFLTLANMFGVSMGAMSLGIVAIGDGRRAYAQRPPGAVESQYFATQCIKCGQCAQNCPYDAIKMAEPGSGVAPGTPYIVPRETPCYMCETIPCVAPCPSGALDHGLVDISNARMGVAVLSGRDTCIALNGNRCEVCYTSCPIMGKAITLETHLNKQIKGHIFFEPVVHADKCTGCGKCEHACILEKPAIVVMDRAAVTGEVHEHFRFI